MSTLNEPTPVGLPRTLRLGTDPGGYHNEAAMKFTTGSKASLLKSVTIDVDGVVGSPTSITVRLAADGTNPGAVRATLSGTTNPTAGQHTYTCTHGGSNDCYLAASTSYFVYLTATVTGSSQYYILDMTQSDSETKVPADNGWSIADEMRRERNGTWGGHSSRTLKLKVTADVRSVDLSATSLAVDEGNTVSYKVKLSQAPSANVAVAISPGGDLTSNKSSLTFSTTNWGTEQTVTLTAGQDADYTDDTSPVTHTVTSSDSGYSGITVPDVTVAVTDDDDPPTVWASSGDVVVPESDKAHIAGLWGFGLSHAPICDVTYTITSSNPSKVRVSSARAKFTPDKYTTPVIAEGLQDADANNETATVTMTITGGSTITGTKTFTKTVKVGDDERVCALKFNPGGLPQRTYHPTAGVSVPEGEAGATPWR